MDLNSNVQVPEIIPFWLDFYSAPNPESKIKYKGSFVKKLREYYEKTNIRSKEVLNNEKIKSSYSANDCGKASQVYASLSVLLYATIGLSKLNELEKVINKKGATLPKKLFDINDWEPIMSVCKDFRRSEFKTPKTDNLILSLSDQISALKYEYNELKSRTSNEIRYLNEMLKKFANQARKYEDKKPVENETETETASPPNATHISISQNPSSQTTSSLPTESSSSSSSSSSLNTRINLLSQDLTVQFQISAELNRQYEKEVEKRKACENTIEELNRKLETEKTAMLNLQDSFTSFKQSASHQIDELENRLKNSGEGDYFEKRRLSWQANSLVMERKNFF